MSEERDLEKELKEEKDRYERQNQEAYDMEIENEIKRKRQAEEAQRQETKRKLKGEARRKQRQERKQVQTGGNTGEEFIPDKTGDFAPAPDRDMRTGEQIFNRETDQFGNPVYESNRQKLQATRNLDPNRFQSQLQTVQKFTPDLSDPKEASEFFTDLVVDTGIIGRSLGEDLPTGIATVIARRLAKSKNVRKTIEDGIGKVAETAQQLSDDTIPNAGLGIMKKMKEVLSPDDPITVYAMSPKRTRSKGFGSLDDIDDLDEFLLSKSNRYDVADESLRKANIDPKSPFYKRLRAAARNVPEYVRRNDEGFLYFDYNLFKDSMRPKQHGRAYIQLFESDLDTVLNPTDFAPDVGKGTKTFREFNIAEFREVFRPAAELLGLTGKKTLGRMDVSNVHHIAALKGTMGIYDGLGFNSPMFKKVNAAMKESIGGTGAERANLIRLVGGTSDKGSPHQLAHMFLDEALGVRGENFFTEDVLQKMNLDDGYRISKARELGRIIADSEDIALKAQEAYKRLADAALATDFKDIQDTLERLVTSKKLGYKKLNNVNYSPIIRETAARGGYNVRQFDELIEDIALIHKAVPTGSPKLIDELLFSPQLLKSQKSFQKLVTKIEERFGEQGVTGAQMRKILDSFDVRMQNAGLGQTGLFEDIPDNLIEDTLNNLDTKIKTRKSRASKRNQEKYKNDPDIN